MAQVTVTTDGLAVTMTLAHESGKKTHVRMTADGADLLATRLFSTARITRVCSCKCDEG